VKEGQVTIFTGEWKTSPSCPIPHQAPTLHYNAPGPVVHLRMSFLSKTKQPSFPPTPQPSSSPCRPTPWLTLITGREMGTAPVPVTWFCRCSFHRLAASHPCYLQPGASYPCSANNNFRFVHSKQRR